MFRMGTTVFVRLGEYAGSPDRTSSCSGRPRHARGQPSERRGTRASGAWCIRHGRRRPPVRGGPQLDKDEHHTAKAGGTAYRGVAQIRKHGSISVLRKLLGKFASCVRAPVSIKTPPPLVYGAIISSKDGRNAYVLHFTFFEDVGYRRVDVYDLCPPRV